MSSVLKVLHDHPEFCGSLVDVLDELWESTIKHGNYASAHEGSSVAREEFEELWEHVRDNTGYSLAAYHEAKQLASTAMKYMQMVRMRNPEAFR